MSLSSRKSLAYVHPHVRGCNARHRRLRFNLVWNEFVSKYEQYTDLLAFAAKNGVTAEHEKEYAVLRRWMLRHGRTVVPLIRRSLISTNKKVNTGTSTITGIHTSRNPLTRLFYQQSLKDLLAKDDGLLIEKMNKMSEAVYHWDGRIRN